MRKIERSKLAPAARTRLAIDFSPTLQRIYATVDSIPRGAVATYGQVAREARLPGRARLVGRALANLPKGTLLAWHRVINAAGKISVRGTSALEQARRLKREGVAIDKRGRISLAEHGWRPD
jgi:methylated-DNA-protein-cysteine methyltransferase-like protein